MREIQATGMESQLPQLLDEVEGGETIVITRHGRAVARLVPAHRPGSENVAQAIASLRSRRHRLGRITTAELLAARDEGRRL